MSGSNASQEQYFTPDSDARGRDPYTTACLRLWAAKLIIHTRDYADGKAWEHKHAKSALKEPSPEAYAMARRWIEDDWDGISSFIWTCELFNLDPERTRRQIQWKWRDNLSLNRLPSTREGKAC